MSKTILSHVDGWTPVIDAIVDDLGLVSAVVFGKAWRYCQMVDGVCKASQERLAEELGLSRATINTHLSKLTEAGYLRDMTPNLLGMPHQYADTGKASLSISLTATCQKDLHPPVKEIDTKKEVKETIHNNVNERSAILKKLYTQNIGAMVPLMLDILRNAAIDYPETEWYAAAFEIAVNNNARNWNYVSTILKNWKEKGRQWSPVSDSKQYQGATNAKRKSNLTQPTQQAEPTDADREVAARIIARRQAAVRELQ